MGIAASFTADAAVPFLVDRLLDRGMAPSVAMAPYNQVVQSCLDPGTPFGGAPLQAVVLLWRIEDLLAGAMESYLQGASTALSEASEILGQLAGAAATASERTGATVIASIPAVPFGPGIDLGDLRTGPALLRFHAHVRETWERLLAATTVIPFDVDALQRLHGAASSFDARTWYLYRQPYREPFLELLGHRLGDVLRLTRAAARKCLVLDCDNVLWGGIVGEEGAAGVALGDEFPGSAHRDVQRLALQWRREGALLALVSKNNEADVWEVFDTRPEMLLRREHLSAWRIDWEPKSGNVMAIARELGIGLESIVFVDDTAAEVEEVAAACPEVACVLLPSDPAQAAGHLASQRLFERLETTAEDARRAEMTSEERHREAVRKRVSPEEFLASLGLEVRVFAAGEGEVSRLSQLVNKTNQFNLTTIRRSPDEVRALVLSPRHSVWALSARDRFGDYGLTGAAFVEHGEAEARIDTFLLSCRVLGREIETALLGAVAAAARGRGQSRLRSRFVPTAKNAPAAGFLARHGFAPGPDGDWEAELFAIPGTPSHIRLTIDGQRA